jgi:hypothetical protein
LWLYCFFAKGFTKSGCASTHITFRSGLALKAALIVEDPTEWSPPTVNITLPSYFL